MRAVMLSLRVLGKKLGGGKLTDPSRVVVRVTEPAPVFHSLGRL
jgi:hypothetical protein